LILLIFLILGIGIAFLFYGAKFIISSLEIIAKKLGVSQVLIGLTVLAIGTSFPDIAISVIGAIDKLSIIDNGIDDIVIGHVIGAVFIQITFMLGLIGLSQDLYISSWELKREGTMMFVSLFIFFVFGFDGILTRIEGLIMITVYFCYILYTIKSDKKRLKIEAQIRKFIAERDGIEIARKNSHKKKQEINVKKNLIILVVGFIFLLIGAEITILCAINIAIFFQIPSLIVGIFIVGIGTTLPEIFSELTALRRNDNGIAAGVFFGSNICAVLLATGIGVIISEFKMEPIIVYFDLPLLFFGLAIACLFLTLNNTLKRWESVLLIFFFGFYAILKIIYFQI